MNWTTALIVVAVVLIFFLLKRVGLVSSRDAMAYLKKGAKLIDVRTAAEFSSSHLPRAINIPLSEVQELTPRRVKNKDQVLLLHCQTGSRSSSAKKILTGMGYTHIFNLGSYQRAARIVGKR
jgi:rhodanese-related sulfurtransferase